MPTPAIDCQKLSKRYGHGPVYALKDLTIQVQPGEVYGFLGPNGAGKSTTIRTLLNFIQPTSGSATILGHDIVDGSLNIRRSVGYLSSDGVGYPKMTGRQFLDYMGELQPPASRAYQQELIKRLKADPAKRLGDLSRGNRQKFGIIQAFMHQPALIILDEPTSGLDPLMQEVFYDLVNEAKQRGATVFASSHILGEVQKTCDRVGIIRDGRLVGEKVIADLVREASHTFDITFKDQPPLEDLRRLPGVEVARHKGHDVSLKIHGSLAPLFGLLAKHEVQFIDTRQLDLEEIFLGFYKDAETGS